MKRIINCTLIGPDKLAADQQICIQDETIAAILPTAAAPPWEFTLPEVEVIDAEGMLTAPGIIDIHSDYIEHMAAPRPTSLMDFTLAVRELERELITHGITTTYHSLSFYRSTDFPDKAIRRPENTMRFVELISRTRRERHLIHHRFHARFEIDSYDRVDELEEYMRGGKVHLLSFMDHTPGQGQYWNLEEFRKAVKGYKRISDAEIEVMIAESQAKTKLTADTIGELCALAKELGIALASHDDDSPEKLELNREFGMEVSEFPINMQTALAAREMGFHTVAGAPNLLLGGSHTGNLSAAEAIAAGAVDVLCSDYYPASLIHAVFLLHENHGLDLAAAFRLVSLNAARAVKIDEECGSLETGKRADLLFIDRMDDGFPVVRRAFSSGTEVMSTSYRSNRQ